MSKYIDSEKLIAEIEIRIAQWQQYTFSCASLISSEAIDRIDELKGLLSFISSLQHEQPEADLEKFTDKIKTFQERYKYPEIVSIKGAMAFMARMFYQYPNVARQWYDSLPKATMD